MSQSMSGAGSFHAYVFSVPNHRIVKVGHTRDLSKRLYNIIWGSGFVPIGVDVSSGTYIATHSVSTKREALDVERMIQDDLAQYRIGTNRVGGRSEWFAVDPQEAVVALEHAANGFSVVIHLTSDEMAAIRAMKARDKGHSKSNAHYLRCILAKGAEIMTSESA